mmetsp:Transcript_15242/g.45141  ORF Transcript_15242/g.45141 Transcript_15242/m.45141 type:complete len:850 (-) Transcript_15242:551-3100(-)
MLHGGMDDPAAEVPFIQRASSAPPVAEQIAGLRTSLFDDPTGWSSYLRNAPHSLNPRLPLDAAVATTSQQPTQQSQSLLHSQHQLFPGGVPQAGIESSLPHGAGDQSRLPAAHALLEPSPAVAAGSTSLFEGRHLAQPTPRAHLAQPTPRVHHPGTIGTPVLASPSLTPPPEERPRSIVDMIQQDFPRTPSPVFAVGVLPRYQAQMAAPSEVGTVDRLASNLSSHLSLQPAPPLPQSSAATAAQVAALQAQAVAQVAAAGTLGSSRASTAVPARVQGYSSSQQAPSDQDAQDRLFLDQQQQQRHQFPHQQRGMPVYPVEYRVDYHPELMYAARPPAATGQPGRLPARDYVAVVPVPGHPNLFYQAVPPSSDGSMVYLPPETDPALGYPHARTSAAPRERAAPPHHHGHHNAHRHDQSPSSMPAPSSSSSSSNGGGGGNSRTSGSSSSSASSNSRKGGRGGRRGEDGQGNQKHKEHREHGRNRRGDRSSSSNNNNSNGGNPPRHSGLLEELRSGKGRHHTLSDLAGHMVALCQDQHGSRFIQTKLESATSADKQLVFNEILPHVQVLMTDVFGNYVVQKFFEHGIDEHRELLMSVISGQAVRLSMQMYGCRVIQKALEAMPADVLVPLIDEFRGQVLPCVHDQNGNHVIQKCVERMSSENMHERVAFIIEAFQGQIHVLAVHPYGCRVIQRMLEHCADAQKFPILDELREHVDHLVKDQYGNYVVQHMIQFGRTEDRRHVVSKVREHLFSFAQHKFASNVVEKCMQYGSHEQKFAMIDAFVGSGEATCSLIAMIRDQYANYVIQKVIDLADRRQLDAILAEIKANLPTVKKCAYGKHILARVEKATGERL